MKKLTYLLAVFFAFTALVAAQEEKQVTQRQPPLITEDKVAKDEAMAMELRKKHENEKRPAKEEKVKKSEDATLTSNTNTRASSKKTSKKPGEQ